MISLSESNFTLFNLNAFINKKYTGLWQWDIVKVVVAASLLFFMLLLFFYGFTETGTRHAIRWTARISVVLFSLAFAASGLHRIFQNSLTFWLLMNRKYLGISFAIIHLIHLFFLVILQFNFHPVFEKAKAISLFGGGVAYLFVVLMLLTSFERFSKHLSKKWWKLLHTVGGYWILFIFFRSYWKRALAELEYLPLSILLVLVIMVRLWPKKKINQPDRV